MSYATDSSIERRIHDWLWQPRPALSPLQRLTLQGARLLWALAHDLAEGQLTLRAMSLVYTTLLSLVPLLAISFSVLKGFGVHNQIEPFLLEVLAPLGERSGEIAGTIVRFVDNTQVGVLGVVGVALLFYTVISLMQKIEDAFNEVWQIDSLRSFTDRVRDYIAVLVIGPVLVFASLGITATVVANENLAALLDAAPLGWLIELLGLLVPAAMVVAAFTCVYIFVPNTRVRVGAAIAGALVAGVLWDLAGTAFAAFMSGGSNVTVIYSGFATPILFMLWLYLGWMILLIGADIAFYRQHPEYLEGRRIGQGLSEVDREIVALGSLRRIGRAFEAGEPGPDAAALARAAMVPADVASRLLRAFEAAGYIVATADQPPRWMPALPWESVQLHEVLGVLRRTSDARVRARPDPEASEAVATLLDEVDDAIADRLGARSLREFALRD